MGFEHKQLRETITGKYTADAFSHLHTMYVYSNIVTPQIVGDALVPLLRTVHVHGQHNEHIRVEFNHLQYVPLKIRNFRTVEINIFNNIGEPMPFHSGEVVVVLGFRRLLK